MDVTLKLICRKLPGLVFQDYQPVHLGLQRGKEVVEIVPAAKRQVTYWVPLTVELKGKRVRLKGPFVQGKPDDPFLYLAWGVMKGSTFDMFRRAKIGLKHLTPATLQQHVRSGKPLEATVFCTDAHGCPICATVPDGFIDWKL